MFILPTTTAPLNFGSTESLNSNSIDIPEDSHYLTGYSSIATSPPIHTYTCPISLKEEVLNSTKLPTLFKTDTFAGMEISL